MILPQATSRVKNLTLGSTQGKEYTGSAVKHSYQDITENSKLAGI